MYCTQFSSFCLDRASIYTSIQCHWMSFLFDSSSMLPSCVNYGVIVSEGGRVWSIRICRREIRMDWMLICATFAFTHGDNSPKTRK